MNLFPLSSTGFYLMDLVDRSQSLPTGCVKAVSSMADKAVMWLLGAVVYFWEVSTMAPLLIFLKRQTLEKHFSEAYAEAFKWGS